MKKALHLKHAAEIWCGTGPTGKYVEVVRGEVRDYGGNVLFAGLADACVAQTFRIPTRLVPTAVRKVDEDVCGSDYTWQRIIG